MHLSQLKTGGAYARIVTACWEGMYFLQAVSWEIYVYGNERNEMKFCCAVIAADEEPDEDSPVTVQCWQAET